MNFKILRGVYIVKSINILKERLFYLTSMLVLLSTYIFCFVFPSHEFKRTQEGKT